MMIRMIQKDRFEEEVNEYLGLKGKATRAIYSSAFNLFLNFYQNKHGEGKGFSDYLDRIYEELKKPRLKGKLSFEDSIQMLINKCMTCEPEEFPENVHRLFWSLPEAWRDDELWDEYGEAMEEVEYSRPVIYSGVPVDPEVLSPEKHIVTETDWKALFNAILNCCNRRNLLIPVERQEIVTEEA